MGISSSDTVSMMATDASNKVQEMQDSINAMNEKIKDMTSQVISLYAEVLGYLPFGDSTADSSTVTDLKTYLEVVRDYYDDSTPHDVTAVVEILYGTNHPESHSSPYYDSSIYDWVIQLRDTFSLNPPSPVELFKYQNFPGHDCTSHAAILDSTGANVLPKIMKNTEKWQLTLHQIYRPIVNDGLPAYTRVYNTEPNTNSTTPDPKFPPTTYLKMYKVNKIYPPPGDATYGLKPNIAQLQSTVARLTTEKEHWETVASSMGS